MIVGRTVKRGKEIGSVKDFRKGNEETPYWENDI